MKIYDHYWKMQAAKQAENPGFPVCFDWNKKHQSELDQKLKNFIRDLGQTHAVLDYGAGNFRLREKLEAWSCPAKYYSLDVAENSGAVYDFRTLQQVNVSVDAVFCLDVLEHLPLDEGIGLLEEFHALLPQRGRLIVQVPNGRSIRNPLAWDVTHVTLYNAPDLWALLRAIGYRVEGYRVVHHANKNIRFSPRFWVSKFMTSRILGCDYADNLCFLAVKR